MPPSSWASRYFPSALNFRLLRSGRNGSASFCLKTSPGRDSSRVSALKFSTSDCHFANPTGSAGGRTSEQPAGRLDKLFIMSRSRFLGRFGAAKEIGKPVARLAVGFLEAIPDLHVRARRVAGSGHRINCHLICNQLLLVVTITTCGLARFVIEEPEVFLADVIAVPYLRDTEHLAQTPAHFDSGLVSNYVSQFVGHDARKFIVALRERDDLARDINAASPNAEGVHTGKLKQEELKPEAVRWQISDQLLADLLQMARESVVVQAGVFGGKTLGHQVAKIGFLLIGENVRRVRSLLNRGRKRAVLLGSRRGGESQCTQEAIENSSHNPGIRAHL